MLLAFVADIHGNDLALQLVEDDMRAFLTEHQRPQFDEVWVLGDIVGYMPWSLAVLERVRAWQGDGGLAMELELLLGNHEVYLFDIFKDEVNAAVMPAIELARRELANRPDLEAWLRSALQHPDDQDHEWTYRRWFRRGDTGLALCHGTMQPRRTMDYHWPFDEERSWTTDARRRNVERDWEIAKGALGDCPCCVVLCGHTHLLFGWQRTSPTNEASRFAMPKPNGSPATLQRQASYLFCVGSVGSPRDAAPSDLCRKATYVAMELGQGASKLYVRQVQYDKLAFTRSLTTKLSKAGYEPAQINTLLAELRL
jgi:hypothetical protein